MTYSWFFGVVTGTLVGAVGILAKTMMKRRQGHVECDERTQLIRAQSGATAFYISLGLAYIGWIGDNAAAYLQGAAPRIVSPWSILLVLMLGAFLASSTFHRHRMSVRAELNATERRQERMRAATILCSAAPMAVSARMATSHGERILGWFLLLMAMAMILSGLAMVIRTRPITRQPER